ncbi:MAG: hypothetical protein AAFR27_12360 [Pseudomonadota bacterium]
MTEDQIKHMTEQFLRWRLPQDFSPDGGVEFQRYYAKGTTDEFEYEPVGTNLLTYAQAEQMVRAMVQDLPS